MDQNNLHFLLLETTTLQRRILLPLPGCSLERQHSVSISYDSFDCIFVNCICISLLKVHFYINRKFGVTLDKMLVKAPLIYLAPQRERVKQVYGIATNFRTAFYFIPRNWTLFRCRFCAPLFWVHERTIVDSVVLH